MTARQDKDETGDQERTHKHQEHLVKRAQKAQRKTIALGAKTLSALEGAELYVERSHDKHQARSDMRDWLLYERNILKAQGAAILEAEELFNIRMCHLISHSGEPIDTGAMDRVNAQLLKADLRWENCANAERISGEVADRIHDATLKEIFEAGMAQRLQKIASPTGQTAALKARR